MSPSYTCVIWFVAFGLSAHAAEPPILELERAEALALASDPGVAQIQSQSQALRDEAVAAAQLPDPKLKLGALALPVDTFDLDQEPMTQLQVGVVQNFPPGQTRSLRGYQFDSRAGAMEARAADRRRQVLREVRENYVEVQAQIRMQSILAKTRDVLADLSTLVERYYGSGQGTQQDVYRAQVELARVDERLVRMRQAESEARARLSMWIGPAASDPLPEEWAGLSMPRSAEAMVDRLPDHPAVAAMDAEVQAARYGVAVAEQQYKPGISVELAYGDRNGRDLTGRELPDFLSAMVMVDLPVFRERRQDRLLSASRHRLGAAEQSRLDMLRMLRREVHERWASLQQIRRRLELFDDHLLPQAANSSQAALGAFQAAVTDLTALMRAQITEYELRLDRARLQADELRTAARLLYLETEQ